MSTSREEMKRQLGTDDEPEGQGYLRNKKKKRRSAKVKKMMMKARHNAKGARRRDE